MKLPDADLAVVPNEKITKYLLDEYHPQNKGKAKFYTSIGYSLEQPNILADGIKQVAINGIVAEIEATPRGNKYIVEGLLNAPNQRNYKITTVWMIQTGQIEPKLVTAYPKK